VTELLKDRFRPEMLNRMDDLIVFNPLTPVALEGIVTLQLEQLKERAQGAGIPLTWAPEIVPHLASWNADEEWGARSVIRAVDELIGEPLSARIITRGPKPTQGLVVALKDGGVVFENPTPARLANQPGTEDPVTP
jgi:ATP-dependent Clp protease ATP-binding subunit ClpB